MFLYLCSEVFVVMERYKKFTFSTIIPDVISRFANNKALGFVDEELMTYAQMGKRIDAMMAFLEDSGIKQGDKVVIYSQNMPNWGISYFAMHRMGVIVVPVLPDFNTHELKNVLQHAGAKTLFVSKNLEYKLKEIEDVLLEFVVCIDDFSILKNSSKHPAVFNMDAKPAGVYDIRENELAVLLYTSGTTEGPKGVMLSQKNVIINAFQAGKVQPICEHDKFLSILPLAHTYENTLGLILPIMMGASVTYLRTPPTASVLIPAIQQVKPDLILSVPKIIEKVYSNKILPEIQKKAITRVMHKFMPTRKLIHRMAGKKLYQTFGGRLKFFGIGGAKLDAVVERFLREARFPYGIGYGLTETSPLLAGSNPSQTKYQAIGCKVKGCELKINDPDPATKEGEVWAKGPNVMLGYYKNKAKTDEVMTPDGWFKTGDLGVFDKKGRLSHKGRLNNLIVGANGKNIYPEEIEFLINNYSYVLESLVVAKKDKLVAMVHFNREELEEKINKMTSDMTKRVDDIIDELASDLHNYINKKVNKFSRINLLLVHPEPFKKTATQKIKRYLYQQ